MANLKALCSYFEQIQNNPNGSFFSKSSSISDNQNDSTISSSSREIAAEDIPNYFLFNYSYMAIQSMCFNLEHVAKAKNSPVTGYSFIKYSYPLLLLFGLCGNALTFLVMCRVHKRKRNFQKFSLSLGTLALADISILLFGCLIEYLEEAVGLTVKALSPATCKLTLFACYLFSCYSAYLHAFIAAERWNAISRPLTSITRFTFKTNRLILGALFLLCIIINLPLLWFPSVNLIVVVDETVDIGLRTLGECQIQQDFILDLIDSFFNCLMPFSLTVIFSLLTLVKLIRIRSLAASSDEHECMHPSPANISSSSPCTPTTNRAPAASTYSPTRIHIVQGSKKFSNQSGECNNGKLKVYKLTSASINSSASSGKSNVKLTLMLMALPISYLVTTFPIFLMAIHGCLLMRDSSNWAHKNQDEFHFVYTLAKFFMYLNNSIHILFYILFGKNLRKDFVALLLSPFSMIGINSRSSKRPSNHRFQSLSFFDHNEMRLYAQQQRQQDTAGTRPRNYSCPQTSRRSTKQNSLTKRS